MKKKKIWCSALAVVLALVFVGGAVATLLPHRAAKEECEHGSRRLVSETTNGNGVTTYLYHCEDCDEDLRATGIDSQWDFYKACPDPLASAQIEYSGRWSIGGYRSGTAFRTYNYSERSDHWAYVQGSTQWSGGYGGYWYVKSILSLATPEGATVAIRCQTDDLSVPTGVLYPSFASYGVLGAPDGKGTYMYFAIRVNEKQVFPADGTQMKLSKTDTLAAVNAALKDVAIPVRRGDVIDFVFAYGDGSNTGISVAPQVKVVPQFAEQ